MYDFDEDPVICSWFIGEKSSMRTYIHTYIHTDGRTDMSAYRVALQFYWTRLKRLMRVYLNFYIQPFSLIECIVIVESEKNELSVCLCVSVCLSISVCMCLFALVLQRKKECSRKATSTRKWFLVALLSMRAATRDIAHRRRKWFLVAVLSKRAARRDITRCRRSRVRVDFYLYEPGKNN